MTGFDHFATVYRSPDEFVAQVLPFIQEGIGARGAVLVALDREKIETLEQHLGPDAARVRFEDMRAVGRNPGAIISIWQDYFEANAGTPIWGVGEPAWPGRSAVELEECRHHECLLNAAFADATDFRLLCPYDGDGLDDETLERVWESHPRVVSSDGQQPSDFFLAPDELPALLTEPLASPPAHAAEIDFDLETLRVVRRTLWHQCAEHGFDDDTTHEFVLAVNELAENSVRHGSGTGRLRTWVDGPSLVAEVSDHGRISDPLAGRRRPTGLSRGGYGLWLTHQVCDLVQVRSSESGTTVRVHMRTAAATAA